jgi:hypothetical protein
LIRSVFCVSVVATCDIWILPLGTKTKHGTGTVERNQPLDLKGIFRVRGVCETLLAQHGLEIEAIVAAAKRAAAKK